MMKIEIKVDDFVLRSTLLVVDIDIYDLISTLELTAANNL